MLERQKKLNLIRLSRTKGIGSVTLLKLMDFYNKDLDLVLKHLEKNKEISITPENEILNEISLLESRGGKIITYLDDDYPWLLKSTDDFPPTISVLGNFSSEIYKKNRIISIVGSRDCSILAKKFTKYIVKELTNRGFITISGMANGIDEVVHSETIANKSKTIAVLGSGLSYFYPSLRLGEDILNNDGIIISELPLFEKPRPQYFAMRNRIIAGMSIATLVIEAGGKSGSIITANKAAKYGRTVFAVPGFPTDDRSVGTNRLIKDGAVMVRDIDDIMEELQNENFIQHQQGNIFENEKSDILHKTNNVNLNEIEEKILNTLNGKSEISLNDINVMLSNIEFNNLLIAISELEIKGIIKRDLLGRIMLV